MSATYTKCNLMRYLVQFRQGVGLQFSLKEPILVDGIRIMERRNVLEFHYKPTGNNGYDNATDLRLALILTFAVSLTMLSGAGPVIRNKSDPLYSSMKEFRKMVKSTGSKSTVLLAPNHIERLSEYTKKLNSLSIEIRRKIYDGIYWYNKGLDEVDLTDKFILFYIMLEYLGSYFDSTASPTAKVKAVLNKYSNNKEITNQIVACRNQIFHGGVKRYDIEHHTQAMDSAIREAFRNIIFNKIPPKHS